MIGSDISSLLYAVDITVYHNGFHGDLNETFFVGDVDEEAKKLVQTTYECLMQAIDSGRNFTFMFFDFTDVHCTDTHTECCPTREIVVTFQSCFHMARKYIRYRYRHICRPTSKKKLMNRIEVQRCI